MSIKKVSVVTPNGESTIMTSRPKAVRAVIAVRQQVLKYVTNYQQARRQRILSNETACSVHIKNTRSSNRLTARPSKRENMLLLPAVECETAPANMHGRTLA